MTEDVRRRSARRSRTLAAVAPTRPRSPATGRTLTRAELDGSTNRLARAYAERRRRRRRLRHDRAAELDRMDPGRARAAGSSARFRSRCPRGCPTPSSTGLLRAAAAGAARRPRRSARRIAERANGFHARSGDCPTLRCPRRCRRCGRRWPPAAAPGGPNSSRRAATAGSRPLSASRWAPQEGDANLLSVPLSHNTGFTTATIGLLMRAAPGADAAVRRRTSSCGWSPITG